MEKPRTVELFCSWVEQLRGQQESPGQGQENPGQRDKKVEAGAQKHLDSYQGMPSGIPQVAIKTFGFS